MKQATRLFCASCVSAVILSASTSAFAACRAGDLAGAWSFYATVLGDLGAGTVYQTQACRVTLTNHSTNPIKYSIAGTCKSYAGATIGDGTISGTGTITETTACRLAGTYIATTGANNQTVRILDARIEDQTRKGNINGIARVNSGTGLFFDLHFNMTR